MRLLLLLLLFFAGCSTVPPRSTSPDTLFDLSGRIAVKYGNEGFYGNLRWIHRKHSDEVWLLSPLGQTVAHIQSSPGTARLTDRNLKEYRAPDVETLTEKILGWRLPLEGLDWWIRGLASDRSPSVASHDEANRIVSLRQDGWEIRYPRRFENGSPKVVVLERQDIRIKFVIDADS